MGEPRRCPHDGGYCHHNCKPDECFRMEHGMSLTTPHNGYPMGMKPKEAFMKEDPKMTPKADLPGEVEDDRCEHGMFYTGAGACPQCESEGESKPKPPIETMKCDACQDTGFVFPIEGNCVQACSTCCKYPYDDDAAAALGEALAEISTSYCILRLPPDEDEELGGASFQVVQWTLHKQSYVPLPASEAVKLAIEVYSSPVRPSAKRKGCPKCGATELVVMLEAAFRWDGSDADLRREALSGCEFPLTDDAQVLCNACEHMSRVRDMKEG